jgi:glucose/arabinose dehydrogenase
MVDGMDGGPGAQPSDEGVCGAPFGVRQGLKLTPVVTGLESPLYVATAPGDDSRLFVLEQPGLIRIAQDGQLLPEPFLDITAQVRQFNSEDGIAGIAFHPDYANNHRFFIHYVTEQVGLSPVSPDAGASAADGGAADGGQPEAGPGNAAGGSADAGLFIPAGASVISEYRVSDDPNRAIAESERRIMVVEQPFTNHNGGMLAFGPTDGFLYLSFGDGGSAGDPTGVAQDLTKLTGKILRIDVDGNTDGLPYGIPSGNMTGTNVRPELWSYGWRNPWRFSFDPCTSDMYIGDVGQYDVEEVDFEPANTPGRNYGWNILEGDICYKPTTGCDGSGTQLPVLVYPHTPRCAVIAGYVYRGQKLPSLRGSFLYADYCTGDFGKFRMQDGVAIEQNDLTADLNPTGMTFITSFGVDNQGEIYVVAREGVVYRVDPE